MPACVPGCVPTCWACPPAYLPAHPPHPPAQLPSCSGSTCLLSGDASASQGRLAWSVIQGPAVTWQVLWGGVGGGWGGGGAGDLGGCWEQLGWGVGEVGGGGGRFGCQTFKPTIGARRLRQPRSYAQPFFFLLLFPDVAGRVLRPSRGDPAAPPEGQPGAGARRGCRRRHGRFTVDQNKSYRGEPGRRQGVSAPAWSVCRRLAAGWQPTVCCNCRLGGWLVGHQRVVDSQTIVRAPPRVPRRPRHRRQPAGTQRGGVRGGLRRRRRLRAVGPVHRRRRVSLIDYI